MGCALFKTFHSFFFNDAIMIWIGRWILNVKVKKTQLSWKNHSDKPQDTKTFAFLDFLCLLCSVFFLRFPTFLVDQIWQSRAWYPEPIVDFSTRKNTQKYKPMTPLIERSLLFLLFGIHSLFFSASLVCCRWKYVSTTTTSGYTKNTFHLNDIT